MKVDRGLISGSLREIWYRYLPFRNIWLIILWNITRRMHRWIITFSQLKHSLRIRINLYLGLLYKDLIIAQDLQLSFLLQSRPSRPMFHGGRPYRLLETHFLSVKRKLVAVDMVNPELIGGCDKGFVLRVWMALSGSWVHKKACYVGGEGWIKFASE